MVDRHTKSSSASDAETRSAKRESAGAASTRTPPSRQLENEERGPGNTGQAVKEEGRGKAEELKERASEAVKDVKEDVKREAGRRVDRGASKTARGLDPIVRALHGAAEELEEGERRWLAGQARGAAEQVNRVQRYLDDGDSSSMLSDLERMARSNPMAFVGATFAAGVGIGRFLRSSEPAEDPGGDPRGTTVPAGTSAPRVAAGTPDAASARPGDTTRSSPGSTGGPTTTGGLSGTETPGGMERGSSTSESGPRAGAPPRRRRSLEPEPTTEEGERHG